MNEGQKKFWQTTALTELSSGQWESLCDGCGRCCLYSFRNGKTGKITFVAVSCRFLDISTCRCSVYRNRQQLAPDCIKLSPAQIRQLKRLPYTCAYRSLAEGRPLQWWHPLISGDPATVHEAGISVKDRVVSGNQVHPEDLEYFQEMVTGK